MYTEMEKSQSARLEDYARQILALTAQRDELAAALRAAMPAIGNACAATDGIAVINALALLRPHLPNLRAALAKVQS